MTDRPRDWFRAGLFLLLPFLLAAQSAAQAPERLRIGAWPMASPSARALRDGTAQVRSSRPEILLLTGLRDRAAAEAFAATLRPEGYQLLVVTEFPPGDPSLPPLGQAAILSRRAAFGAWTEPWKGENAPPPPGGFAFAAFRFGTLDLCLYAVAEAEPKAGDPRGERTRQLARHVAAVERRLNTPNRSFAILGGFEAAVAAPLVEAGFSSLAVIVSPGDREASAPVILTEQFLGRNLADPGSPRTPLTAPVTLELVHTAFVPRPNASSWWPRSLPGGPGYYWGGGLLVVVVVGLLAIRLQRRRSGWVGRPQVVHLSPRSDLWKPEEGAPEVAPAFDDRSDRGSAFPPAPEALAVQENLIPHLARMVKDRLLWTMIRQRRQLVRVQDLSTHRVVGLEQRLAVLQAQLHRQTQAYEQRIRDLEGELGRKEQLLLDLRQAQPHPGDPGRDAEA